MWYRRPVIISLLLHLGRNEDVWGCTAFQGDAFQGAKMNADNEIGRGIDKRGTREKGQQVCFHDSQSSFLQCCNLMAYCIYIPPVFTLQDFIFQDLKMSSTVTVLYFVSWDWNQRNGTFLLFLSLLQPTEIGALRELEVGDLWWENETWKTSFSHVNLLVHSSHLWRPYIRCPAIWS